MGMDGVIIEADDHTLGWIRAGRSSSTAIYVQSKRPCGMEQQLFDIILIFCLQCPGWGDLSLVLSWVQVAPLLLRVWDLSRKSRKTTFFNFSLHAENSVIMRIGNFSMLQYVNNCVIFRTFRYFSITHVVISRRRSTVASVQGSAKYFKRRLIPVRPQWVRMRTLR